MSPHAMFVGSHHLYTTKEKYNIRWMANDGQRLSNFTQLMIRVFGFPSQVSYVSQRNWDKLGE